MAQKDSEGPAAGSAHVPLFLRSVLALIGFTAVIAQIVLLRELVVLFYGNEASLGLMLANWLLWTALGSSALGRLARRGFDPRKLMAFGTVLMLWSMWEMSRWTPAISETSLVTTTFIQGIGMGFVFVPSNLVAFATLAPFFRTDGSALLNLVRNLGAAIGVSVTTTVLANAVQTTHAQLAEHVSPLNPMLSVNAPSMMWNPQLPFGLAQIDALIMRNAYIVAYSNDFVFMFFISLPALLVIFLMKRPSFATAGQMPKVEVME